VITDESARRTEMVKAQIGRDRAGAGMSRQAFLATLGLKMHIAEIRSTDDRHFQRALELINKTNQFNTTGARRTLEECIRSFQSGTTFFSFELQDKFSHYGLVGVAVVHGARIGQFVMSCRVLGLGAEAALLAHLADHVASIGCTYLDADYAATTLNAISRDFFHRSGFAQIGACWRASVTALPPPPPHIEIVVG
jgi:FkbH-like protein